MSEQVICKNCGSLGEEHVSGETAKFPNRIYYLCPVCPATSGRGNLFLRFGPYAHNVPPIPSPNAGTLPNLKRPFASQNTSFQQKNFQQENVNFKRLKTETPQDELGLKRLHQKMDAILAFVEEISVRIGMTEDNPRNLEEETNE
jgi:hypothetical protein